MEDPCGIVACLRCLDDRHCAECATDFVLGKSGAKCILPAEKTMIDIAQGLLIVIGVIIVLSIIAKAAFVIVAASLTSMGHKLGHGASSLGRGLLGGEQAPALNLSLKALNVKAIGLGMANWRRARLMHRMREGGEIDPVHDADLALQASTIWTRFCAYLCDVHTRFIVGVGLPVFYNFHALPAMAAVLAAAATSDAVRRSGFGAVDEGTPLEERERLALAFAERLEGNLLLLFLTLLVISLLHARGQKRWRDHFDRTNSTMEDYTLGLKSLPFSMTSEAEVQKMLEAKFGVPVVGVSIGYNLNDPRLPELQDKIWGLKERLVVSRDSSLASPGSSSSHLAVQDGFGYDPSLANPEELRLIREGHDRDDFRELVPKLRGSGLAWVVFRSKAELDFVRTTWRGIWVEFDLHFDTEEEWRAFNGALGRACHLSGARLLLRTVRVCGQKMKQGTHVFELRDGAERSARVRKLVDVYHSSLEPPSVLWDNLGVRPTIQQQRLRKTVLTTILVFFLLLALIFIPLGRYLLQPYAAAHAAPGFVSQQLQGFIFGLANNILGITMWLGAWGVGFRSWDEFNFFVVMFGVAVSFFNTVFFLAFGMYPELRGFAAAPLLQGGGDVASAVAGFAAEEQLASTFYDTLVPGWLFSGFIMGQAMGNIWPTVQNMLLLLVVFACDCLPYSIAKVITLLIPYNPEPSRGIGKSRLTARQAELIFQPQELSLAWDYASYIVMPTTAFGSLFALSPRMGDIFPVLLAWVAFMYSFHRLITLRITKKQMYASANLVVGAEYLWGIPLATVAAAWAFWGYRLGHWSVARIPVATVGALVLYCGGIMLLNDAPKHHIFGEVDVDYWRVVNRLQFSWFNCNPIHVLKSTYCPEAFGGAHVRARTPFFFGKEYLFEEEGGADWRDDGTGRAAAAADGAAGPAAARGRA